MVACTILHHVKKNINKSSGCNTHTHVRLGTTVPPAFTKAETLHDGISFVLLEYMSVQMCEVSTLRVRVCVLCTCVSCVRVRVCLCLCVACVCLCVARFVCNLPKLVNPCELGECENPKPGIQGMRRQWPNDQIRRIPQSKRKDFPIHPLHYSCRSQILSQSGILVKRDGSFQPITKNHDTLDQGEFERIRQLGGFYRKQVVQACCVPYVEDYHRFEFMPISGIVHGV